MKTLSEITEVKIPADFDSVIDHLNDSDGFVVRTVLYCDRNLCTILEQMKLANRNIRGSYGGGDKLKKLYRKKHYEGVEAAVIKFCKKHNIKVLKTRIEYHYDEVK